MKVWDEFLHGEVLFRSGSDVRFFFSRGQGFRAAGGVSYTAIHKLWNKRIGDRQDILLYHSTVVWPVLDHFLNSHCFLLQYLWHPKQKSLSVYLNMSENSPSIHWQKKLILLKRLWEKYCHLFDQFRISSFYSESVACPIHKTVSQGHKTSEVCYHGLGLPFFSECHASVFNSSAKTHR